MEPKDKELPVVKQAAPAVTERRTTPKTFIPLVDIYETKDSFVLIADVPGVDDKSMEVTLEKNVLTIHGTVEPMECKDHDLSYTEYDMGNYHRSFILSGDIDRDKIEANVKDGVLHLTLPKTEKVKVKKITVH